MDADDLLQEAWLGALIALPMLDPAIGSADQFLIQRARWRLLSFARKAHGEVYQPLPGSVVSNDISLHSVALEMDFDEALKPLNPMQHAIVQHLLAGLTWREIGDQLGCTSANIGYHMRQIRAQLRCLAPSGLLAI
jgi:RNA polymerase sigma factor (sigma-70 family)